VLAWLAWPQADSAAVLCKHCWCRRTTSKCKEPLDISYQNHHTTRAGKYAVSAEFSAEMPLPPHAKQLTKSLAVTVNG
jgi:hypothetical protein